MLFDLSEWEAQTLLKNGSTNQKNFIEKAIKAGAVGEVFNTIENLINDEILTGWMNQEPFDLRGALNGGVLFLTDAAGAAELSDNNFLKYEIQNDLFLCIE